MHSKDSRFTFFLPTGSTILECYSVDRVASCLWRWFLLYARFLSLFCEPVFPTYVLGILTVIHLCTFLKLVLYWRQTPTKDWSELVTYCVPNNIASIILSMQIVIFSFDRINSSSDHMTFWMLPLLLNSWIMLLKLPSILINFVFVCRYVLVWIIIG